MIPLPAAMRLLLLLPLLLALPSCETERTVLAGPQKVSAGGYSDYDPNASADEMAARMSATGQTQAGAGSGFNERFSFDSGGYGKEGLNIMSGKMFGDTKTRDMKEFTQTKDFLTKRYGGGTRELEARENASGDARSWFGSRKARTDQTASESGQEFAGGSRVLDGKRSREDGRTLAERTARESTREARTRNFYPAEKVIEQGGDAPKMIGEGKNKEKGAVFDFIRGRDRDNPATVQEIRDLLGKRD
jgi:hypothetical protein